MSGLLAHILHWGHGCPRDSPSAAAAIGLIPVPPASVVEEHLRGKRWSITIPPMPTANEESDMEEEQEEEEAFEEDTHFCGNCGSPSAKSKCMGCGVEYYCNRECQTVGWHQ